MKIKNHIIILLLLLLIVGGKIISAQSYHPFIVENKFFKYSYICDGPCSSLNSSAINYFDGDTIINSKVYQKLYANVISGYDKDTKHLAALMREDTTEQKVYMYYGLDCYKDFPYYNTEQVLFDFSMQVGDSVLIFSYYYYPDSIQIHIESINSVILEDGSTVRKFNFLIKDKYSDTFESGGYYTERIAGDWFLIDPISSHYPGSIILDCVNENNIPLLPASECVGLNVLESKSNSNLIHAYPTCVRNELIVESEVESATLYVYDMNGNQLLKEKMNKGVNSINCAFISQGNYVYKVVSPLVQTEGKIIKTLR